MGELGSLEYFQFMGKYIKNITFFFKIIQCHIVAYESQFLILNNLCIRTSFDYERSYVLCNKYVIELGI
jgi:hypothetical protein